METNSHQTGNDGFEILQWHIHFKGTTERTRDPSLQRHTGCVRDVRDGFLAVPGGPLVSIAVAANVMGGITGSASGGLIIALNALGETYAQLAAAAGIDAELMHRVASISSGALAMLPHNGAVVTLVAICGATQRGSYREIMMVGLVGPLLALTAVIALGKLFGAF